MSLIWIEGFDYYQPGGGASLNWSTGGGVVGPLAARNGAQGMGWNSPNQNSLIQRLIGSNNGNTMVLGYALKTPGSYSGTNIGVQFMDGVTTQCELRVDGVGHIVLTRNGTVLVTSTLVLTLNAWHYIEFKVKIANSGGIAEAKVDGVLFCTFTGDTQNTADSYANTVQIRQHIPITIPGGVQAPPLDDIYLLDSTGSINNDYLGDSIVQQTYAIADGGTNNWTDQYASWTASTVMQVGDQILDSNGNVQEVTAVTSDAKTGTVAPTWSTTGGTTTTDNHVTWTVRGAGANPGAANWMAVSELYQDGDNSYVVSSTPGDIDLYQFGSITSPGGSPNGVQVTAIADKDDAGTRSIRLLAKSGAVTVDNGVDLPLTQNTYQAFQNIFQTDPNTGVQWTAAGINAARFGEKEAA